MEYVILVAFLIYLAPWMLAEGVGHPRAKVILWLNLVLGWTVVGWLGALGWVVHGWPRPRKRPRLVLVTANMPPPKRRRWPASAGAAIVLAGLAGMFVLGVEPSRSPERSAAQVDRHRVVVRMGPNERWPSVGELSAPCRLSVLAREGAWREVWRLENCEGSMKGQSGWVRMEDIRADETKRM